MTGDTPQPQSRVALQIVGILLALAAGLWILHRLERVVLVLVLAIWFAYVLAPLVKIAECQIRVARHARRMPRGVAILLVYLLIAGGTGAAATLLLPTINEQVADLVAQAPTYTQGILTWENGWSGSYKRLRIPSELRKSIDQSVGAVSAKAVEYAEGSALAVVGSVAYVPWLVLIPILAFFLLRDAASLRRTFVRALPFSDRLRGHRLFEDLNSTLAAYMRAQLLACLLVGVLTGVGLALLGIPYPALLGVLAGVLEFIPLVGPLTLAAVAALIGTLRSPMLALWAMGFLAILRLLEDYVIYPRLLGRSIHLHPLAVILAVLAGAELDGIAGMFLAVPISALGWVVFRHWLGWHEDGAAAETAVE